MSVGSGPRVTATALRPTPTLVPDETLYTFTCQGNFIHPLAWSPDGKRLGSTCLDVTTRDATTGNNVFSYGQSNGNTQSLSWSPDGKRIQASGQSTQIVNTGNQSVKVWDAATGRVLVEYQPQDHLNTAIVPSTHANPQAQANPQSSGNAIASSSWSPDGTLIASSVDGGGYGYEVQVWNSQTGTLVYKLQPNTNPTPGDYISEVSWSPDGKYIALTVDGNVQVWSIATKSIVTKYTGVRFSWSPDSKKIVSTEVNGSVQVWNALTGAMIFNYEGHVGQGLGAVAWSPDGKRIASAGIDVQVWNATTGAKVYTYNGQGKHSNTVVISLAWSPDSKYIASSDAGTNENEATSGLVYVWVAK
jgi:WD40 repeat protein